MTKIKTSTLRKKDEDDASLFITGSDDLATEDLAGSDGELDSDDERAHSNLIKDIGKLSKKKRMGAAPRSVRFSTREGGTEVDTEDILKRIGIPELEKSAKKVQALPEPLEKVAIKRAKRIAGFEKVACESEKWASLVHKRRTDDQLTFPLQQPDLRLHTKINAEQRIHTPLEKEVYALLQGAKLIEDKKETSEMKAKKRAMSLEELKERNRLIWREREQRRRIERKAWMQNKNKSRKYHRLLRKDRLKKQRAELEELQKSNPEAALEKLEELERARVQERGSLRHKHSKWAHLQGLRASRDESALTALKENLVIHQDLTAKRKMEDSSSEEEEDEEMLKEKLESLRKERQNAIEAGLFDPSNPWTANLLQQVPERVEILPESAVDDSFVNFKRFWEEVNRRKLLEKKALAAVAEKEHQVKINEKDQDGEVENSGDESVGETKDCEKENEKSDNGINVDADENNTNEDKVIVEDVDKEIGKGDDGKLGNKSKEEKTKKKKKLKKIKDDINVSEGIEKQKKKKKGKGEIDENRPENTEESKIKGKKQATKKDTVKKKDKLKKKEKIKVKDIEGNDKEVEKNTKKTGKKAAKKTGKKVKETGLEGRNNDDTEDLEDHLISIDNMFSQAELGLQRKLKKKLEKLGIDDSIEEWTVVKSKKKPKKNESSLPKIEEFEFTSKSQDNIDEGLEHVRTLEDIDNLQKNSEDQSQVQKAVELLKMDGISKGDGSSESKLLISGKDSPSVKKPPSKPAQVDPSKFLQVDAKVLQSAMPDTITKGVEDLDDDDEDEEDADDVIKQAFADDYLIDEFKSAKDEAIEQDKPKTLSLVLPGWGEWTGPNIKVSKRKKRRFTINLPPPPARKDETLGHVIYNEKADVHDNLRKAMVSELPYPFSRVQDFEASVRAPVGRMFLPEKQHQKLTAPPVITKMGAVIEPMTEEELLKNKRLYDNKHKQAGRKSKRQKV